MVLHPIAPIYDENSQILILGSFPSVKSREENFYYRHPQNRFWKVLSAVFKDTVPLTVDEKRRFLLRHGIALWDVIQSCEIEGSADSSIRNVTPNDISVILQHADIQRIFLNGKATEKYYAKYLKNKVPVKAFTLPSTSPANAAWSLERLTEAWKIIR